MSRRRLSVKTLEFYETSTRDSTKICKYAIKRKPGSVLPSPSLSLHRPHRNPPILASLLPILRNHYCKVEIPVCAVRPASLILHREFEDKDNRGGCAGFTDCLGFSPPRLCSPTTRHGIVHVSYPKAVLKFVLQEGSLRDIRKRHTG